MSNNKMIIYIMSVVVVLGLVLGLTLNTEKLKTGIYRVESENFIYNGYKPFLVVEVKSGRMISATFNSVNEEGELITNDRALRTEFLAKYGQYSPESLNRLLSSEFLIKQGTHTLKDVVPVENIRNIFIELAESLLSERIYKGNEDTLIVNIDSKGGDLDGK